MTAKTKVTVLPTETPSQQVVRAANAEHTVHDSTGRAITLKKPGILTQFKLIEMLGPEASANSVYVQMVLPITYVTAIDGEPEPRFTTRMQMEALIQRLDEHGIAAVMVGVNQHFGAAPDVETTKAAVKN